jgi:uncharacterized membrane protein
LITTNLSLSEDLAPWALGVTLVLFAAALVLLWIEGRRGRVNQVWVIVTGVVAASCVVCAICRPVTVEARTASFGPRIVTLVDDSRRSLVRVDGGTEVETRRTLSIKALERVNAHFQGARNSVFAFSDGTLRPFDGKSLPHGVGSDLVRALQDVITSPGELPSAIVLLTDGRLTRPGDVEDSLTAESLLGGVKIPVHTVSLLENAPPDVSIRKVQAAGAAVAHQPLSVTVEVGCSGGVSCSRVPVTIKELLSGEPPTTVASGIVAVQDGIGRIEMTVTLNRSGSRVLEVAIEGQSGDVIPENDKRYLSFSVAKERVRLLHLAGRPTYDVRALRAWLKSDEAVDTIAFFILRGETDDPDATEQDLALIRFPVDELFTEHLPSFDAIILQDIDAVRYKLDQYLPRLANYVKKGGGLIMVGGPSSFSGGNYAGTPIDAVLPVEQPRTDEAFDSQQFVPRVTAAGRSAPVTRKLRSLLDDQLPPLAGANHVGAAKPGTIVLWEHPRIMASDNPMPLLAMGEAGDGRSIALAVDSTHRLAFGELASSVAGRGYGALWDGLLGWLMRDPRYEAARIEVVGECIAGESGLLRIHRLPGMDGEMHLDLEGLTPDKSPRYSQEIASDGRGTVDVPLRPLPEGGFTARVTIGSAPATRFDFGCEAGGQAWTDSRPDPPRLAQIATTTGGTAVTVNEVEKLPLPALAEITAERRVAPLLPSWVWSLCSAVTLGLHWVVRRKGGLP